LLTEQGGKTILYAVTDYTTANVFGFEQVKSLAEKGFSVILLCGIGPINPKFTNYLYKIIQLKSLHRSPALFSDILSTLRIIHIILKYRPQILIYSTPKASLLVSIASVFSKSTISIYQIWGARWQNSSFLELYMLSRLDRFVLNRSTHRIAVSASIKKLYEKLTREEIIVLGKGSAIGVDDEIFRPLDISKVNKDKFILGYAGRLARDKGISDLLTIFDALRDKLINVKLQVIGELDRTDSIDSNTARRLEVDSDIEWIKSVDRIELAKHMQEWTIQVFPSTREGLGNAIIESQAVGVPTICWDLVGTTDAICPRYNHLLIPYGDLKLFITRLEEYCLSPHSFEAKTHLSNWTKINFSKQLVLGNFSEFVSEVWQDSNEE